MRSKVTMITLLATALAAGCGDDDSTTMDGGPGTPDAMTPPDGGPPDTGVDLGGGGDGNDTFTDATPVTLGVPVTGAVIDPPGDLDYYSFEGTADQWLAISTEANPDDDPDMVDTVVTLFDSTMTQIAENDDSIPRFNTDSELITRLPAAGTYYVLVQEFSTWAGEPDEGMASFTYDLTVAELDPAAFAVTVDTEGGDDVASAQELGYSLSSSVDFGLLVGGLRDGSDVDVFSFSISALKPFPEFTSLPGGTDGSGSTATPSAVWVTDAAGTEIIGRVDPAMLRDLSPALPAGDYLLWIEHGGSAGANDFYVLKAFRYASDNPPEMDDTLNGVAATADPVTLADADGDGVRTGFLLAMVTDGDTDFFSFDATAGEVVSVFCGSRTAGSGVIDLEAALMDATGTTTIDSATETATTGVALEEVAVGGAGTYLLRLTKGGQDVDVTGNWVRCGIALGAPTSP